jgi:hypothetical protein
MQTYWAYVRTGTGTVMKVTVNADSAYNAYQMFLAMYTKERMISEFAAPMPYNS